MGKQGWSVIPLYNLPIQIIDGDRSGRYPKREEFQTEGIVFLNSTNIIDNRLALKECNFISKEKYQSISKGRTQHLDIVMTTRGSIGKVALIQDHILQKALINAQMLILRANPELIDPKFLFYVMCNDRFQNEVHNFSSGSAQPQIPIIDLKQACIPLPPLPIQRKIAAILSAYDDLIENNLRRIAILEQMAQNLYREWFVKFRFPGHEQAQFVDSPLGRIPAGWEVKQLGEIVDQIRNNIQPDSIDANTPYFGLEHLPRKSITLFEWGKAAEVQSTKLLFEQGDILFGKIRPYFHKVGVAPIKGVCSSDIIVMRSKRNEWFGLALGCASSDQFIEHATATSQGTKMPRANWNILSNYKIVVPSYQILDEFNRIIYEIVHSLHNLLFRNNNLRKTRDMLLPKLISGELDVSELEIASDFNDEAIEEHPV